MIERKQSNKKCYELVQNCIASIFRSKIRQQEEQNRKQIYRLIHAAWQMCEDLGNNRFTDEAKWSTGRCSTMTNISTTTQRTKAKGKLT